MRVVRYFFVGTAAAAVDIGVFGICVKAFHLPWFPVAVVSFVLATLVNYALSVRHVFTSGVRFGRRAEVALVFAVSLVGLAVNQSVLWLLIERLGADALLAKAVATATVFFWNYAGRSRFIFRATR